MPNKPMGLTLPQVAPSFVPQQATGFKLDSQAFVPGKKVVATPVQQAPAPAPAPAPTPVPEDPLKVSVERAGYKPSDDDMRKLRELIGRLKGAASQEERSKAMIEFKTIASIAAAPAPKESYWAPQIDR